MREVCTLLRENLKSSLPRLVQHTSWGTGRWPPPLFRDSGRLPPARQHAASFATSKEHRHPWSSHPEGAGEEQGAGSPSLEVVYGCPALTEHVRCALGCVIEMQRQHLKRAFAELRGACF